MQNYSIMYDAMFSLLLSYAKNQRITNVYEITERSFGMGVGDFVISVVGKVIGELRRQGYYARTEFYGYYAIVCERPKNVIDYQI